MSDYNYLSINSSTDYYYVKEFSSLISEIESNSCGTIANVIRKLRLLDSEREGSNEVLSKFIRYLDNELLLRDQEIEKFCNHYYQGFVESIKELLKIQQEGTELKQSFSHLDKSLIESIRKVTTDCVELSKCHTILNNIDKAIESLQACIPVFDQYLKAEKCINEKRYYPALKTLNHLELNQMQRVRPYALSETLQNQIPGMRDKIKSASKDEIKDFLENVRKHSVRLGACAMKQIAEKMGMEINMDVNNKKSFDGTLVKKGFDESDNKRANPFTGIIDERDVIEKELQELASIDSSKKNVEDLSSVDIELTNVEDLVDFGPVYRCLHIHSVLGDRHEFEKLYRSQRKRQCMLLLTIKKQESIRNYYEFFSGVVGFFVVEDYIRYSQISMVTRNYLDELWTNTLARVGDFVSTNSANITEIETLLKLKDSCVLFGKTMRSLGFNVASFKDLYDILRKRYQNLLGDKYSNKFQEIFEGEDYTAILVKDASEMELVIDLYPSFLSPDIDLLPYPKNLSFSWMVPRIYHTVRQHITKCRKFADNLEFSQIELEYQLSHTTNVLFSNTLLPYLQKSIKESERELNRLIQLAVNMDELESACHSLQNIILTLFGGSYTNQFESIYKPSSGDGRHDGNLAINPPRSKLHAFELFKNLRSKIEDHIYKAIYAKIDAIFDDNEYHELNSQNSSSNNSVANSPIKKPLLITDSIHMEPSECIRDVISYLCTTFESFTNLPVRLAQTACLFSCKYISEKLMKFLNNEVRLTDKFMKQLALDIKTLKDFTRTIPVAGVSSDTLTMVFEELRQLTDLVLLSDWNKYIQHYNKLDNPYDRVFPSNAINLLEKSKHTDTKFSALLKSIKKNKQDKIDEEILRQLKDLK